MKIQFWTVGRDHGDYVKEGISDFSKRLNNYFSMSWKILPVPRNAGLMTEGDLKKKEGEAILRSLSNDDFLVALDENGRLLSSPQLASFLQSRANESLKQLVFLIGGAYGLDDAVMKRANFMWSLSPLTFPHQLVRLILSEQVYRACTILRNEKYHHR